MNNTTILQGNNLETLKTIPPGSVRCCVTSPPYYGLRDYGHSDQIGLEETPELYIENLLRVFRLVWDALAEDGTLWLNLGDSYNGSNGNGTTPQTRVNMTSDKFTKFNNVTKKINGLKPKDLCMIPARVAIALQQDGWYLRSEIVWHKPNPMPESVKDRPTRSHEMIYLLSKSERYYYDADAIREPQESASLERLKRGWNGNGQRDYPNGPQNHLKDYMGKTDEEISELEGRNKRDVWTVTTKPYSGAHFATFPPDLIEPCVLAGSAIGDTVLDPFGGSGTTAAVALQYNRKAILCELNESYIPLIHQRLAETKIYLPGLV